jgi:hypothetical protein
MTLVATIGKLEPKIYWAQRMPFIVIRTIKNKFGAI